jgi:hypothetical protein
MVHVLPCELFMCWHAVHMVKLVRPGLHAQRTQWLQAYFDSLLQGLSSASQALSVCVAAGSPKDGLALVLPCDLGAMFQELNHGASERCEHSQLLVSQHVDHVLHITLSASHASTADLLFGQQQCCYAQLTASFHLLLPSCIAQVCLLKVFGRHGIVSVVQSWWTSIPICGSSWQALRCWAQANLLTKVRWPHVVRWLKARSLPACLVENMGLQVAYCLSHQQHPMPERTASHHEGAIRSPRSTDMPGVDQI